MAGKMTLYKLVVLGDGGVGKTALTIQLCLNHFVETYDPTIEDSYRKQVQIDGQSCMLEVLDTAGQEEYIALRDQWIRDGEGFVLVYSISSRSSFARIQKFHHQIQRVKETSLSSSPTYPGSPLSASSLGSGSFGPVPVMLVGNKCDRVTEREVSTQEGSALAKELGCEFVEASAKNCVNVEKAFFEVVRQLRRQRHQGDRSSGGKPSKGAGVRGGGGGRTPIYHNDSYSSRGNGHKPRIGDRTKSKRDKPKCQIL
ncbi:ras-domain-containing protein [Lojkania enalia]|uniref:Ras-domain-containing protein n=1 Tax=Lojkania enalia TaxID=147567 RepID=A0A9P4K3I9_9PLEO|nr:ras-domain-containing protein [Didymosphaeria enalia]